MKVGTVIRWENFPKPKYNNIIKPRWFIYVGKTDIFSDTLHGVIYYLPTTTTKKTYLGNNFCTLQKSDHPFFFENCYLNLDERPMKYLESKVEGNPDIKIMGCLDKETMEKIYNCVLRSDQYSQKDKKYIYDSYCYDGISEIKDPSGRKKRK